MITNEQLIHKFYTAFANSDSVAMCECYHSKIQFSDPVFGLLNHEQVCAMWQMLIKNGKGAIQIEYSDIEVNGCIGKVKWIATYNFSKTNRKVINVIYTQFQFQDGLILKHTDNFDIWKWAKQALGWTGYLFGWTGYMHNKIQQQALVALKKNSAKKL